MADFADKRDSRCLPKIVKQVKKNLNINGLTIKQLAADTGYSSGEALKYCEENDIDAYIPNFGQYKFEREGFIYNEELDQYECQRGNKAMLPFKNTRERVDGYQYKQYSSSTNVCKNCPLHEECCGKKSKFKEINHSIHKEYYDNMHL